MREWKAKPVNFKTTNPEHMDLYRVAGSLPNFSAAVLDMLRSIRDGRQAATYAAYVPPIPAPSYDFISREEDPPGDDQFLL